jgi:hypothetical protein
MMQKCVFEKIVTDEGMTLGSSILAYLVFGPGGCPPKGRQGPQARSTGAAQEQDLADTAKTRRTRPSRIRTCLGFIQTASISR